MFGKPNLKPGFWGPIFEAMFDHRVHILVKSPSFSPKLQTIMDVNRGTNHTANRPPVQQNTSAACP